MAVHKVRFDAGLSWHLKSTGFAALIWDIVQHYMFVSQHNLAVKV